MHRILFVFLLFASFTQAAEPPCSNSEYRQWDFWLGSWRVESPDGVFQGNNNISAQEKGCLLLENWTGAQGGTGQSFNFYNSASNQWRQLWVSPGAIIDYSGGLTQDGSMRLEGHIAYPSQSQESQIFGCVDTPSGWSSTSAPAAME